MSENLSAEKKDPKIFFVSKSSVEGFVSASTRQAMYLQYRMNQKVNSVTVARKLSKRIASFDEKMTAKFGRVYKTTRNIALMTGLYVTAGSLGVAGLTAFCAYKMAKHVKPILVEAEKERRKGKSTGVIDYIEKHKTNSIDSLSSVAFSATSAASLLCGFDLPIDFAEAKAMGKNVVNMGDSVKKSITGKTSWKDTGEVILSASLAMIASSNDVNSVVAKVSDSEKKKTSQTNAPSTPEASAPSTPEASAPSASESSVLKAAFENRQALIFVEKPLPSLQVAFQSTKPFVLNVKSLPEKPQSQSSSQIQLLNQALQAHLGR